MKQINEVKTTPSENHVILTVKFEREINDDELEMLRVNFADGAIKADPDKDLLLAMSQQLSLELQEACDHGLAGNFFVEAANPAHAFADEMWRKKDGLVT